MRLPAAFAPLLLVRARYKGYWSGRGVAKTHSFAAALIQKASTTQGFRWLCTREIQRSIKESVKRVLDLKIDQMGLNHIFHSTNNQITCVATGAWIGFEGLHNNIDNIRSYEDLDGVWIEEAATVSRRSLEILIPTIRKPGSEIWCSWNPRDPTDPVDELFRKNQADQADFFAEMSQQMDLSDYDTWMIARGLQMEDNPFFPVPLRMEVERDRRRDPDRYAHVWLGQYRRNSEARVFKNWTIGTMDVPPGTRPHYGSDFGFSIDPTVALRIFLFPEQRKLYIDDEVSKVGCAIEDTPALFDQLGDTPGEMRNWPAKADSSRPETIHHMNRHGYPKLTAARKGPGSVEEGVQFLQGWDIVVHPNCKGVTQELTLYSFEVDKQTEAVLPTLADKHNHFIDALRYALEDVRRAIGSAGPIVVLGGPRSSVGDHPGLSGGAGGGFGFGAVR